MLLEGKYSGVLIVFYKSFLLKLTGSAIACNVFFSSWCMILIKKSINTKGWKFKENLGFNQYFSNASEVLLVFRTLLSLNLAEFGATLSYFLEVIGSALPVAPAALNLKKKNQEDLSQCCSKTSLQDSFQ